MADFTISIHTQPDYVLTVFHRPATIDIAAAFLKDLKTLTAPLHQPSFIFDARGAPNQRSPADDYFSIHDLAKDFFRGAKIAVVVDPGDHSYDFIDTVAGNVSYQHRIFEDMDKAIAWIKEPQ